jgi:hypothetical protein
MRESSPYSHPPQTSPGSGVVLSAVAGAVLGAAGLAWWLLSEAERRRLQNRQARMLRLSRLQDGSEVADALPSPPRSSQPIGHDRQLHDKVHELNQAIDDVRRQLEAMATAR